MRTSCFRREPLVAPLAVLIVIACATGFVVSTSVAQDTEPPKVDCWIKTKRTYSLQALKRKKAVTVATHCDGATRALVDFEVRAPISVDEHTPHLGVPDAEGEVAFDRAGTKNVRVKLHPRTARAIRPARWVKGSFGVSVEIPDEPGAYYGLPDDRRRATFRD